MSESALEILNELQSLSRQDRAELACGLIESLETPDSAPSDAEWESVLTRRGEEIDAGTAAGRPAGEVLARPRAKWS